jgi:hypothetical protein
MSGGTRESFEGQHHHLITYLQSQCLCHVARADRDCALSTIDAFGVLVGTPTVQFVHPPQAPLAPLNMSSEPTADSKRKKGITDSGQANTQTWQRP